MPEKRSSKAFHALQFNVAQLLKQPTGTRRTYDVDVDIRNLDDSLSVTAPLHGAVRFLRAGNGVLVTGTLKTEVDLACVRCLSEFGVPVQVELEEEFQPTVDVVTGVWLPLEPDQDSANLIDEHHILDLAEVVRQGLWLSLPPSPVCRADCQGLCPICGQNLNEGKCNCETEPVDPRWTALLNTISHQKD